MWREAADHLLREAGVSVLFHTVVTGALLDGERVTGATAWSKEGPVELRAKLTIDASGDADLVAMAGFESFIGDGKMDGQVQNPTMIFRLGGVDTARFVAAYGEDTILPEQVSELLRRHHRQRLLPAALEDVAVPDDASRRAALQLHPRCRAPTAAS